MTPPEEGGEEEYDRAVIAGVALAALAGLVALSLASSTDDGENAFGLAGSAICSVLTRAAGFVAWAVPFELGIASWRLMGRHRSRLGRVHAVAAVLPWLITCALVELLLGDRGSHSTGWIGERLGNALQAMFGLAGSFAVGVGAIGISWILRSPKDA